jgi:hypothetical protein
VEPKELGNTSKDHYLECVGLDFPQQTFMGLEQRKNLVGWVDFLLITGRPVL